MEQLQPGDILDNFKITKHLKQSTVAHIYTANDVVYQDTVVLKIPLDNILAKPELLYHHQNEERVSHRLDHPSIVRYLQRLQSHQYLILEYIEGETLKKRIRDHTVLSLPETIAICSRIAEGIDYLHTQKVIHLDIKPENVLITRDNNVKIIDFGLAHLVGAEDLLGKDFNNPPGTPDYISPEQLCGVRSCWQSDVYSLGIVVYEMLTGRLPHPKSVDLNELRERLIKPPIPPRHYNQEIPPAVQEILLKALAANPDKRYQTAAGFVAALAGYKSHTSSELGGEVAKPASLLPLRQSSHNFTSAEGNSTPANLPPNKSHILGCIAGSENLNLVMDHIRREALLNGSTITLLHVLDEELSDYIRHSIQVEQETFSRKLDESISALKKVGLSPVLRIKTGKAAEKILETARELSPDLIILGPPRSRKILSLLLHGSVLEKVAGAGVANVTVANTFSTPDLPQLSDKNHITLQFVDKLELYLWDSWVIHLNSLTDIPKALSGIIDTPPAHPLPDCPFSQLLGSISHLDLTEGLHHKLENCHAEFHSTLDHMADSTKHGYHDIVRNLYKYRATPLSLEFKHLLMELLVQLRSSAVLARFSFNEGNVP